MKIRNLIKSDILKNITDRNELSDEQILFKFKEFMEGRYTYNKTEPSICFKIEGDTAIAYMNHELINKFELNNIVITNEIGHLLEKGDITTLDINELLSRHTANMSDCCKNDKKANELDIKHFGRVFSYFKFKDFEINILSYLYDKNNIDPKYIDEFVTCIELV